MISNSVDRILHYNTRIYLCGFKGTVHPKKNILSSTMVSFPPHIISTELCFNPNNREPLEKHPTLVSLSHLLSKDNSNLLRAPLGQALPHSHTHQTIFRPTFMIYAFKFAYQFGLHKLIHFFVMHIFIWMYTISRFIYVSSTNYISIFKWIL